MKRWIAVLCGLSLVSSLQAYDPDVDDEFKAKEKAEREVVLPAFPVMEKLIRLDVGPAEENRYFLDPDSISVDEDGEARYTLVTFSTQGVRNVSHEGMSCPDRQRRPYAFGRPDGSWSKARSPRWQKFYDIPGSRHFATIFLEHLCPDGIIVRSVEQVQKSLRSKAPRQ
ncbi:MAG: hypothetical protein RIR00_2370 [Pseudomonadota bacterium]